MAGLLCPHCGVATPFNPISIRGEGILLAYSQEDKIVKGDVSVPAVIEPRGLGPHFAVIQCPACHSLFVAGKEYGSYGDWQTVWPLVVKEVSVDVPKDIRAAFTEALSCLAIKALGGCLMMCRTTLIRLQRHQKVASLKELRGRGIISDMLYQQADEMRLWANVIGHEDFDQDAVTVEVCDELVAYVDSLVDAVYVQPARLARHREQRKQAKARRKPA